MIAAEGEQKASKALKEAADVLQQSPSALQVQIQRENKCKDVIKEESSSKRGIGAYKDKNAKKYVKVKISAALPADTKFHISR